MAITGTGSRTNPYSVTNYTDLNTIIKGHGTYWDTDRCFIRLDNEIYGAGANWDLSVSAADYGAGFDIDMNGHSIVGVVVTTGSLLPVWTFYDKKLSRGSVVRNGTFVDIRFPDANASCIRGIWFTNVQFVNINIYHHRPTSYTDDTDKWFMSGCFVDNCNVRGTMYLQNRGCLPGEVYHLRRKGWFISCNILHSDVKCDMVDAGENLDRHGLGYEPLTYYMYSNPYLTGQRDDHGSYVIKTRFRGDISGSGYFNNFVYYVWQYNVVDIDLSECDNVVGDTPTVAMLAYNEATMINVANTDKLPDTLSVSTGYKSVTSNQITDGAYLRQLNFPVRDVIIS